MKHKLICERCREVIPNPKSKWQRFCQSCVEDHSDNIQKGGIQMAKEKSTKKAKPVVKKEVKAENKSAIVKTEAKPKEEKVGKNTVREEMAKKTREFLDTLTTDKAEQRKILSRLYNTIAKE